MLYRLTCLQPYAVDAILVVTRTQFCYIWLLDRTHAYATFREVLFVRRQRRILPLTVFQTLIFLFFWFWWHFYTFHFNLFTTRNFWLSRWLSLNMVNITRNWNLLWLLHVLLFFLYFIEVNDVWVLTQYIILLLYRLLNLQFLFAFLPSVLVLNMFIMGIILTHKLLDMPFFILSSFFSGFVFIFNWHKF